MNSGQQARRGQIMKTTLRELKRHGVRGVQRISPQFGVSDSTLRHWFKREVGVSMRSYVMWRRLHLAAALLLITAKPIKEIQYRCGFSDAAVFNHRFRSHFGLSPTAFRSYPRFEFTQQIRQQRPIDCACTMRIEFYNQIGLKKMHRVDVGR